MKVTKEILITVIEDSKGVATVGMQFKNIDHPMEVLGILQYAATHQSIISAEEGAKKMSSEYKKLVDNPSTELPKIIEP